MDDHHHHHHQLQHHYFSVQERVACCFWFDISRSTDDVQEKFQKRFGHGMKKCCPPSRQEIRLWYQRFIKTGCLIHDDNGNLDDDENVESMTNNNNGLHCPHNDHHHHHDCILNSNVVATTTKNGNSNTNLTIENGVIDKEDGKKRVTRIGRPRKCLKKSKQRPPLMTNGKKRNSKRKSKK
ncbi:hypothetical protein DERF_000662 [Dermatophagoides farinae]|uniref:DUF4817 domain-containing protein n=1 Tax=Dermatophagoides farinae TaxID=6954 RepID=A0A922IC14_DERFA|nr:hypothetical protein DERF_000662 [Dermatophagoides farinae]